MLISDWETNTVYITLPNKKMKMYLENFDDLLIFYKNLINTISKHNKLVCIGNSIEDKNINYISYNIGDIWIRDFGPLQFNDQFIKFQYNPLYGSPIVNKNVSKNREIFLDTHFRKDIKDIDLVLEGGNIVHNGEGIAIITERIFRANPTKTKEEIEKILKEELLLNTIIFIPPEPYDKTGHVDGMVRFLSPSLLVINDYTDVDNWYHKKLYSILSKYDFEIEYIPYAKHDETSHGWYTAKGNYTNFLNTKDAIYVPIYDDKFDDLAMKKYQNLCQNEVVGIESSAIAKWGGIINCITWNIKL